MIASVISLRLREVVGYGVALNNVTLIDVCLVWLQILCD